MRSEHRMSWRCVFRDHTPQAFETREAFLNHMTEAHTGKFRVEQLPFIAESSARALSPTVPVCPFCTEAAGDLEDHVAQHLYYFALQSLPWPEQLDHASHISGLEMNSYTSEDVDRETLKDDLAETLSFIDGEWLQSLDTEPEPLLDAPVSWSNIERIFTEPDRVLIDFAAHAARRAAMDIQGEPETLDEELLQVREQLPTIIWVDADMDTRLLRASLRGPWGFEGEHIMLNVKVAVPHAYPEVEAPRFLVEEDEHMPEVVREMLQREVREICQLHLQRKETCLAPAFSYLLGARDLTSSINMFNVERGHAVPLGDVDEDKPPPSPVSQPDKMKFAEVADNNEPTASEKTEAQPKSGYLNKRGKTFGAWKSRFYVVEGPQLKYYDAAGGAQLGSIQLQGAQIAKGGRQQPWGGSLSAAETQFNHSMSIIELNKGSRTRHVLCAESDEERDRWVEALLPWVDYVESEAVKTDSATGGMWPTSQPGRRDRTIKTQAMGHETDSSSGKMLSTRPPTQSSRPGEPQPPLGRRPITTVSTGYEADSSSGNMWSTQQPVQSTDTKTKINKKGQFVTVVNSKQQNRQDEPSLSHAYKSGRRYERQA